MQRSRAKLGCVAVCAASALLCASNGAPLLAAVQGIAAIVVWRVRFGLPLASTAVHALIVKLREARTAEEAKPAMIRATVTPNFVAVPSSAPRRTQTAVAFRDEMMADRWRQVTTALRHQPHPAVPSTLITKIGRS